MVSAKAGSGSALVKWTTAKGTAMVAVVLRALSQNMMFSVTLAATDRRCARSRGARPFFLAAAAACSP